MNIHHVKSGNPPAPPLALPPSLYPPLFLENPSTVPPEYPTLLLAYVFSVMPAI